MATFTSFKYGYLVINHSMIEFIRARHGSTTLRHGRYFIVEWDNNVCAINATQSNPVYAVDESGEDLQHYMGTRAEFNNFINLLTLACEGEPLCLFPSTLPQLAEMDTYELRRVLLTLYAKRLGAPTYSSLPNHIANRIARLVASRFEREIPNWRTRDHTIIRKGQGLSPEKFMRIRVTGARLNNFIKGAIKDHDWTDVAKEIRMYERVCRDNEFQLDDEVLERFNTLAEDEGYIQRRDCGHVDDRDNAHFDVGRRGRDDVCCACFDDEYVYVEDEDAYWHTDDAYYHDSDGNYYSYEEQDDDDDEDEEDDDGLMGYSTNVLNILNPDRDIKSSHFGEFLMGVELEMCAGRDYTVREASEDVREELGQDYCITKSDGSLPSDGFEVVTAPRGLTEHIKRFKDWDIKSSYRAWNSGQCGLHVHIDSRTFNALTLGKFIQFINADDNADFIRKVAGRHPLRDDQARHYCASESQTILANPKTALKGKDSSRYRMVNTAGLERSEMRRLGMDTDTCNGGKFNTVELRIFRASLKKERLLSQIEFTHAAVMFCRTASMRDLTESAFKTWLSKRTGSYPSLAKWYEVAPKKKANPNATAAVSSDESVSA